MVKTNALGRDSSSTFEISLPYIDKLAQVFPWDADAIPAELLWRQRRPENAADLLEKCLRTLHEQPSANRDVIKRSLIRAELIAKRDLDQFTRNETSTTDVLTLTKKIRDQSSVPSIP